MPAEVLTIFNISQDLYERQEKIKTGRLLLLRM